MSEWISIFSMVAALCLLSFMVMKGINIFIAAMAVALIVAAAGSVALYDAIKVHYMSGFVGFVQNNFLIFLAGALMAKAYENTLGAKAIAKLIISYVGPKGAIISVPLAIGILTYGGIAGFVVCFAVFPIALEIFRAADIPRRFIPGTIIFGCCTFSSIGPGNPQVGNVVLVNALGTTLMSGATVGFIATGVTLGIGFLILNTEAKKARKNGEHFTPKPTDVFHDDAELPNGYLALFPLILTLICINVRINGRQIIPIEFGVALGAALAYFLLRKFDVTGISLTDQMGEAVKNAVTAVCNTSAVVGFGAVVQAASGFPVLVKMLSNMPGPPLLAVAVATTLLAGVCGSGSGGLGIAAPILAPVFTDRGLSLDVLHRTMLVASSGLDTLPHNGFVVTVLNGISSETHNQAYPLVFKLTVVTPVIATVITIVLFTLFPNWP